MRKGILVVFAFAASMAGAQNDIKGQAQLKGINGVFGTVYSLKDGFNYSVLKARYTVDPVSSYNPVNALADQKILVVEFSIKNATPQDNYFAPEGMFGAVDTKGQIYEATGISLESKGAAEGAFNLKPGQGLGQTELKDPLRVAFLVPGNAKIDKLIIAKGRLNTDEEVIRFPIVVANPKKEDKNVIAPLPENVRDADPTGAVALAAGKLQKGSWVSSGPYGLLLEDVKTTTEALGGAEPNEGQTYIVATITAKNLSGQDVAFFELMGGDTPLHEVLDADGERYRPIHFYKASKDEDADKEFKPGDEYKFRIVFQVPKDAKLKTLTLGAASFRKWSMPWGG